MPRCIYCDATKRLFQRNVHLVGTDLNHLGLQVDVEFSVTIFICEPCMHNKVPKIPLEEASRNLKIVQMALELGYKFGKLRKK